MRKQHVHVTITLAVDADGAQLLPGWPGHLNPDDPGDFEPPIGGLAITMDRVTDAAVDAMLERLPTVLGAQHIGSQVLTEAPFDPDEFA